MSAHDATEDLPPFKIEFLPLQPIFDDFVLIFCQNLQVRCLQKRIDESLLSSYLRSRIGWIAGPAHICRIIIIFTKNPFGKTKFNL
jgi:hypothetical protein